MSRRGRFISLEGGEGVGKSTQVKALAEALRERGIDVLVTREPGGSEGAERIRELLLSGSDDRWGPQAEALLFAAARADHVDKTIRPALEAGNGCSPTASSTARSPIRAVPAGSGSRRCAQSTPSASAMVSRTGLSS